MLFIHFKHPELKHITSHPPWHPALRHGSVVFILNTSRLLLSHFRQCCPTKWIWNHMKSLQDPKSFLFKVSHWLLSQPYGAKEMHTTLLEIFNASFMRSPIWISRSGKWSKTFHRFSYIYDKSNEMNYIVPCLVAWLGTWEFQGSKPPVPPAISSIQLLLSPVGHVLRPGTKGSQSL